MENYIETRREAGTEKGFYWLRFVVEFNVVLYVFEIIFKLMFDLLDAESNITFAGFLLGTSPNWQFFLKTRLVLLGISIVGAAAGWLWQRRRY